MKLLFLIIILSQFPGRCCFSQDVTPAKIERSQEILQQEEELRRKALTPQKVFIKEIVLPQGIFLPPEEVKEITGNFAGYRHSLKEIQDLLDNLTQLYRKTYPQSQPLQASYTLEKGKLRVNFKD